MKFLTISKNQHKFPKRNKELCLLGNMGHIFQKKPLEVSKQTAILKSRRRKVIEMRRFVNGAILCQKDWRRARK